ncbi:histidine phosphatase family protein [Plantactinospora sp. CA-294935]|uniref:histidine phosphatase family protein n=1 Tax=Plantactinospora sp. CA-294935 TaxID=3240012 RepID=UPI003D94FEE3
MQTEVVLVRHAKSVPPSLDGPDEFTRPLSPVGLQQALDLVDTLAGLRPTAVWSSPYLRAVQTVQPTARALGLPVHAQRDLREWEDGLPFTDDWDPHYEQSWSDPSFARPGGESLDPLTVRAVAAVRALASAHPGELVLAASHGTLITRALRGFGAPADRAFAQRMPTPALYHVRFADPHSTPAIFGPRLHTTLR